MRIAIVSEGYFPEVSGVIIAVANHLTFLAARGHELLLLHPHYPERVRRRYRPVEAVAELNRVEFDSAPILRDREESRSPTPAGTLQIEKAIEQFAPSAVIYHNPDRLIPDLTKVWKRRRVAGIEAARAQRALAIPIVHTLLPLVAESSGPWLWRSPPGAALARRLWCDIYNSTFEFGVTVDEAARAYLQSIGMRIPFLAGPFNGCDTSVFRPRERRERPGSPMRICCIGRLQKEKKVQFLPHLARELRSLEVPFELRIIGDGPLREALQRDLGPARDTVFHGWIAPEAVAEELSSCSLYLSLSDTESYSLTATEALACGVPVVAPDAMGMRRLAGKEVGFLFPPRWLNARGMRLLAEALRQSRSQLGEWSSRAAAMAPRLSWDIALRSLYSALEEKTGLSFL